MKNYILTSVFALLAVGSVSAEPRALEEYLYEGQIQQGIDDYTLAKGLDLKAQEVQQLNNEERFSLGVLLSFSALEGLSQDFHRLGLGNDFAGEMGVPFLRLNVPKNLEPELATAEGIASSFENFAKKIATANKILEGYDEQEFSLPLELSKIRLDINADGKATAQEAVLGLMPMLAGERDFVFDPETGEGEWVEPEVMELQEIDWDRSDLIWLKGYTHILLSFTDILLSHDWSQMYEQSAHLFFRNADTFWARQQLSDGEVIEDDEYYYDEDEYMAQIADLIATIHRFNLPVSDPDRLKSAHTHLLKAVQNSRVMWESILAEEDDQTEWIPNPKQRGMGGVSIEQAQVDAWMEVLEELELILEGEKLIPHWRFQWNEGINLKRVFYEPRNLDLILWVQGTAAIPYLEKGEVSSGETWEGLLEVFEGNFAGFATWVN